MRAGLSGSRVSSRRCERWPRAIARTLLLQRGAHRHETRLSFHFRERSLMRLPQLLLRYLIGFSVRTTNRVVASIHAPTKARIQEEAHEQRDECTGTPVTLASGMIGLGPDRTSPIRSSEGSCPQNDRTIQVRVLGVALLAFAGGEEHFRSI